MKFHPSVATCSFNSPLGLMHLAATDAGLAGVWFHDQQHLPDLAQWRTHNAHPVLQQAQSQLQAYVAGQLQQFHLALDISGGTLFQQSVWQALLKIPYGQSASYGDIAKRINNPKAVRAVGAAVGRNPISIIIPCHRVVGSNGALTGYAGGLERKVALIHTESQ